MGTHSDSGMWAVSCWQLTGTSSVTCKWREREGLGSDATAVGARKTRGNHVRVFLEGEQTRGIRSGTAQFGVS